MDVEARINGQIRAYQVLLIDAAGTKLGIKPTYEAIKLAEEANMDLVEINPKATPIVCKIMDWGKFKYEQKKRMAEASKNSKALDMKEIQLHSNTFENDMETKLKNILNHLEDGHKVKVSIRFRGGEIRHTDLGMKKLDWIHTKVVDANKGKRDTAPSQEGKQLFMILSPN